jgi:hypothetical protein
MSTPSTAAISGRGRILYYDILERPGFTTNATSRILFDVVEHIENPHPFLEAVLFHVKPGGCARQRPGTDDAVW